MINRFFKSSLAAIAWTIMMQMLFCLPGSSLPSEGLFSIPYLDKIVHIILFAAFVALWSYFFYSMEKTPHQLKKIFFLIFLAAAFNGILIEFIQRYYIPGRSFDKGDIVADLLGASISYGICNIKLLKIK